MFKDWKKEVFTIPNMLSLIRLILIPVYVMIYLEADSNKDYYLAAAILAVSCLTDLVDGKIARHFNMISNLGKILDPLADKLTQFTLLICLLSRYSILWVIVPLFVIKELFQLVAGGLSIRKGKMLKGAQMTGKICTTVLFISLIVMVMIPTLSMTAVNIITFIDLSFLIAAFADYIIVYCRKETKFQDLNQNQIDA